MGKMCDLSINEMNNMSKREQEEMMQARHLDDEYYYDLWKKEQAYINAERATVRGGINNPQMKEGGRR